MAGIFTQIAEYLIMTIGTLGYPGIFVLMAIESTIFPLPSELVLIPAGVLMQRGELSLIPIIVASCLGSLFGALVMYYLSLYLGRKAIDLLVVKYGKFLFLTEDSFLKAELFFKKHGEITIFLSRLLPFIRHLISIPAGFSKMNVFKFSLYTLLGAAFWSIILVYLGYFLGQAAALNNLSLVITTLIILSAIIVSLYIFMKRKKD